MTSYRDSAGRRSLESTDWIEHWLYQQFPNAVHPELTRAYRDNVYRSPRDAEIPFLQIGSLGTFSRSQLAEHMQKGDEVGRYWAETMCIGTFHQLSSDEKEQARTNPEFLVRQTVERYQQLSKQK